jgi:tetratricopeptide (TPR) repeat protein
VFAAEGAGWLFARGRPAREWIAGLVVLGGAAVVAALPLRAPTDGVDFRAELYTLLGIRAQEAGDGAGAQRLYGRALAENPGFAEARNQLGLLCAARGDHAAALGEFERALALRPAFAEAHSNAGTVLQRQGRHDAALARFEEALRLRPHLAAAGVNAALSCLALGRGRESVAHLERAVASDPAGLDAANLLAWVLATHPEDVVRDGRRAVPYAENLCRSTLNANGAYLDTLAAAYAESGRFEEAVAAARKALDLGLRSGHVSRAEAVRGRLEDYMRNQPYRDATLAGGGAKP